MKSVADSKRNAAKRQMLVLKDKLKSANLVNAIITAVKNVIWNARKRQDQVIMAPAQAKMTANSIIAEADRERLQNLKLGPGRMDVTEELSLHPDMPPLKQVETMVLKENFLMVRQGFRTLDDGENLKRIAKGILENTKQLPVSSRVEILAGMTGVKIGEDEKLTAMANDSIRRHGEVLIPVLLKEMKVLELEYLIKNKSQHGLLRYIAEEFPNDIPYEELAIDTRKSLMEISPEFARQMKDEPCIRCLIFDEKLEEAEVEKETDINEMQRDDMEH